MVGTGRAVLKSPLEWRRLLGHIITNAYAEVQIIDRWLDTSIVDELFPAK